MQLKTMTKRVAVAAGAAVMLMVALVWSIMFHPRDRQSEPIFCDANTPLLKSGQTLKVLSWNVQFVTGKRHGIMTTSTVPFCGPLG